MKPVTRALELVARIWPRRKGFSWDEMQSRVARSVVMRVARGNTSIQAGRYCTREDLERDRADVVRRWAARPR